MDIDISKYNYKLEEKRIALFPVAQRENAKLLIFNNNIKEDLFGAIKKYLPKNTLFIYNDTKVFHARLRFRKTSGACIELFCLEPVAPLEMSLAMSAKKQVQWKCLVGNSRRWKNLNEPLQAEIVVDNKSVVLSALRKEQQEDYSIVTFSWEGDCSFAEIVEAFGDVPLPPYIHRETVESDNDRYQTVYANIEGSVAAPTAGLHFTKPLIDSLKDEGISFLALTLHVGAGTFKPMTGNKISEHQMHAEKIIFTKKFIQELIESVNDKFLIPVGTTSCRSLESLYWFGVMISRGEVKDSDEELCLEQWYPYRKKSKITVIEALKCILKYMTIRDLEILKGTTSLMIVPGYEFRLLNAIVTNFHQPKSTLLLLISAIVGDKWSEIYNYAMQHDFRFLSYGDSCLLFLS